MCVERGWIMYVVCVWGVYVWVWKVATGGIIIYIRGAQCMCICVVCTCVCSVCMECVLNVD